MRKNSARICSAFRADFGAVLRFLGRARHKKKIAAASCSFQRVVPPVRNLSKVTGRRLTAEDIDCLGHIKNRTK
jgi:hypothetical protein